MMAAWSLVLAFLILIDRPPLIGGVLYLYRWLSLDQVTRFSSNWTSYSNLTAYHGGGLEPNIIIWIGRTHVYLYPDIIVQLLIWLICFRAVTVRFKCEFGLKIAVLATNFISNLSTVWTTWSLNRTGTLLQRFWRGLRVTHPSKD